MEGYQKVEQWQEAITVVRYELVTYVQLLNFLIEQYKFYPYGCLTKAALGQVMVKVARHVRNRKDKEYTQQRYKIGKKPTKPKATILKLKPVERAVLIQVLEEGGYFSEEDRIKYENEYTIYLVYLLPILQELKEA
jgi:hypothetical protein